MITQDFMVVMEKDSLISIRKGYIFLKSPYYKEEHKRRIIDCLTHSFGEFNDYEFMWGEKKEIKWSDVDTEDIIISYKLDISIVYSTDDLNIEKSYTEEKVS